MARARHQHEARAVFHLVGRGLDYYTGFNSNCTQEEIPWATASNRWWRADAMMA
jgi:hypothetical protein